MFFKKKWIGCLLFLMFCMVAKSQQTENENKLAFEYFNNQEYEKAGLLFDKLYNASPTNINYEYYLQTLIHLSQWKEAEKLVKKQIRLHPKTRKYQIDLGHIFDLQDENNKAKKQYETIVDNLEQSEVNEIANVFANYHLNDYTIKTYLQGRKRSEKEDAYAMELALCYQVAKEYEKAMQEYLLLLRLQENKLLDVESTLLTWWLNDDDYAKRTIIRNNLLKAINKYPENQAYSNLMIWYAVQEKDFSFALKQAKAFDKRYKTNGAKVMQIADYAFDCKDFTTAKEAYEHIVSLEYTTIYFEEAQQKRLFTLLSAISHTPKTNLTNAEKVDKELKQYFSKYAVSDQNVLLYRQWMTLKSECLNELDMAIEMLLQQVEHGKLGEKQKAMLKIDLAGLKVLQNDVWEATLLYSQVEKAMPNDTLAQRAKLSNAKLSLLMGEIEWAEAQLDVLRAATSKYVANDAMYLSLLVADNKLEHDSVNKPLQQFFTALFLIEHHRSQEALIYLDSISQTKDYVSLNDDILFQKAKIAILNADYQLADSLYNELIVNYPFDLLADDALFERAFLQEFYLKDNISAMQLYQRLVTDYPDSIFTIEARKRYRTLRGDMFR